MSFVEKARERLEEVRTKGLMSSGNPGGGIRERLEEVRTKGVMGALGGSSNPSLPTLKEVREKGILTVLADKFPRIKEIRERGILGGTPKSKGEVAGEVEGEGIILKVKKGIHGDVI